jgi:hypothetical protein
VGSTNLSKAIFFLDKFRRFSKEEKELRVQREIKL